MRATLKDVSYVTGYSLITISRVINTPEKVKEETRNIILKAIEELEYSPNIVAKALVTNQSKIIFLFIPNVMQGFHPFVAQVVAGIGEELGKEGYSILLKRTWYDNELCDGVISLWIEDEDKIYELSKVKPLVFYGQNNKVDWIDTDNVYGSEIMTDFILSKGYKKIAYVGINQRKRYAKDRLIGFKKSLSKFGINESDSQIIIVENNEEEGYKAAKTILNTEKVEAIICASDLLAIGAIRAANELGIEVGKDLGITGFDGLGYDLISSPKLTTIEQPVFEIGQALAKRLLYKLKHSDTTIIGQYYKPRLIVRDSMK